MHMDEILSGMTEMALERLYDALVEADLHAAGRAGNARWQGDPVDALAWDEAGSKVWLIRSIVAAALLAQQAENERIAAL